MNDKYIPFDLIGRFWHPSFFSTIKGDVDDVEVEIWSLFNRLESIIESLVVNDHRTMNAYWRLAEARMWIEKLEVDEFDTRKWPV